jgi:DNA-binding transcriptional MerR regulator
MTQIEAASGTPKYLIGAVTKLTGLSIDVVRVWERRYGAVRPARSAGGTRLYSDADVLRLRRLRQAVEHGYGIGQAARLSETELDELVGDPRRPLEAPDPYGAVRSRFIAALHTMDVVAADQELARGATLFPVRDFVKKVVVAIHDEIGERRARSELGLAHERLGFGLLRNTVSSLLRLYPASENAETLVLATASAERDEIGLLVAALLAAMHGWRVVYLGGDLPANEIAQAVRLTNARVVALSLTTEHSRVAEELEVLSKLVSTSTRIWVYGAEAAKHRGLFDHSNWVLVHDLDELDDRLRR